MIILGIETSTAVCAACLAQDNAILSEKTRREDKVHSEILMSFIDECLISTGCNLSKLDGIAISIGPGSFTGLRIGLSVAKGLAYATAKPLAAVPTLEALAHQAIRYDLVRDNDYILPVIRARRDEGYCALYRRKGGSFHEMQPVKVLAYKEIQLPARGSTLLMGDGAGALYASLAAVSGISSVILPDDPVRLPTASTIALLGTQKLKDREFADAATIEPLYVKEFSPRISQLVF